MSWLITNLWLIPAVPLAISLVILSLARSRCKSAAALAIIGQAIALAFAIGGLNAASKEGTLAWALMQIIFAPIQGSLSDHFGRRPVILISCAGLGLDFILMALAPIAVVIGAYSDPRNLDPHLRLSNRGKCERRGAQS